MHKYRIPIFSLLGILLIWLVWSFVSPDDEVVRLSTKVKRDAFRYEVVSSGELIAKNSENITAPAGMQRYGFYQIKIANIVDEGTYVEAGDFVASLDKTDITTKINERLVELDKANSVFTQTQLDTALTLREKRNELEDLVFQIKQKEIELNQSVYEPPATVQRMQLDLQKLKDDLERKKDDYQIKKQQSKAKMIEAGADLQQTKNQLTQLQDLEKEFNILAPKKGMVTYYRSWSGKVKSGSTIQPWNPVVATLPDLSKMLSLTFINEVDIRKVKEGQMVNIGLDAFPDAQLNGKVVSVANMGESRENSDSKVFEVEIEISESDSLYRPGMTTSNHILINELSNELQIPLEAVFGNDSLSYVYMRSGMSIVKQEVLLGPANDEVVIIKSGLKEEDEVLLNAPDDGDKLSTRLLSKVSEAQ
jgi:RND family efflux transporter MFP subunit